MKMTMKMKKGLSVLAVTAAVLVLTAALFVGAGAATNQVYEGTDFVGLNNIINSMSEGDTLEMTAYGYTFTKANDDSLYVNPNNKEGRLVYLEIADAGNVGGTTTFYVSCDATKTAKTFQTIFASSDGHLGSSSPLLKSGDILLLPAGTLYDGSSIVDVYGTITVVGAGEGYTIIYPTKIYSGKNGYRYFRLYNRYTDNIVNNVVYEFTFKNLTFDGTHQEGGALNTFVVTCYNIKINADHVTFKNFPGSVFSVWANDELNEELPSGDKYPSKADNVGVDITLTNVTTENTGRLIHFDCSPYTGRDIKEGYDRYAFIHLTYDDTCKLNDGKEGNYVYKEDGLSDATYGFNSNTALGQNNCWINGKDVSLAIAQAKIGDEYYYSLEDAVAAVDDGQTIEMLTNVTLSSKLVVNNKKQFIFDLGENTLTGRVNFDGCNVTIRNGAVNAGSMNQALNVYGTADPSVTEYTTLTIAEDVTITGTYGVCFLSNTTSGYFPLAYGVKVNHYGTSSCVSPAYVSGNIGYDNYKANIGDVDLTQYLPSGINSPSKAMFIYGPEFNVYGKLIVTGPSSDESAQGITLSGMVKVNVYDGAQIVGSEGIGMKSGIVNVYGGTIISNGVKVDPVQAVSSGSEASGAAISVTTYYTCDEFDDRANMSITVLGGTISSVNNSALLVTHSYKDSQPVAAKQGVLLSISDGAFIGGKDVPSVFIDVKKAGDSDYYPVGDFISGGCYSTQPKDEYIANFYQSYSNEDSATKEACPWIVDVCEAKTDNYQYGGTVSQPTLNAIGSLPAVTYYYSSSAVDNGNLWSTLDGNTLGVGTYYVYGDFTLDDKKVSSKRTTFKVTQASQPEPGITSAVGGDGYIQVKVGDGSVVKNYEYNYYIKDSAHDDQWNPISDNEILITGLNATTTYVVEVKAKENINYTESSASSISVTTLSKFSVSYNANGGIGSTAQQSVDGQVVLRPTSIVTRAGYTVKPDWYDAAEGGESVSGPVDHGMTLYAQWTPNQYTVAFYGDSAASITADYGETITLPTATGGSGTFAGWAVENGGSAVYTANQKVQNLAESGTVTLYPVWKQDTFTVSGTITGAEGTVTINLTRGNAVLQTNSPGTGTSYYSFDTVPAGTYNIVATDVRTGKTVTVTYIALGTTGSETVNIEFPPSSVSSVLNVSDKQNTPAVVVGGLDQEAVNKAENGKNVTVTMDIEAKVEADLPPTASEDEKDTQSGISAIKVVAGDKTLQFLGVVVTKTVEESGATTEEVLHETSTLLEILIPFDANNKENIVVYRYHNGQAETLTRIYAESAKADGTFLVDETAKLIYVYSQKFSEYAIGYTVPSPTPTPTYTSSSSKQTGYTQILSEGEVAPTAVPTVAPTVKPTEKPATPSGTSTILPTAKPKTQATQASPAPFVGLLAGLGAAALFLRLRK